MSDTTPAPAATPEAQAADGQQMELEQPNSEHAPLSPEQLRAELEAARKEAARYRTQLRRRRNRRPTLRLNDWPNRVNIAPYTSQSRPKPTPPTHYRNG
jgi:hypothetical protein